MSDCCCGSPAPCPRPRDRLARAPRPGGPIHSTPDHGAVWSLPTAAAAPAIQLVLDLDRALLHVLHDDPAHRWEGRTSLGPLERAAWSQRLGDLDGTSAPGAGGLGRLSWASPGRSGAGPIAAFDPRRATGLTGLARDLLRHALRAGVDHPLAMQALSAWNAHLGLEPTVAFVDGRPRGVRLVGIVDRAGQANLEALTRVLRPGEPLWVDVSACASFGAWEPEALLSGHVVAWVGARAGVSDRLRDLGVPAEALHRRAGTARAWLRDAPSGGALEEA